MLLNPKSQGIFKTLRTKIVEPNPLELPTKKRERELILDHSFVLDDIAKRKKIETEIFNNFGFEEQPILEKLTFKIYGDFKGKKIWKKKDIPASGDIESLTISDFLSTVVMEGPNVLEGLKELATAGILEFPFPKALTNIASMQKNVIDVGLEKSIKQLKVDIK